MRRNRQLPHRAQISFEETYSQTKQPSLSYRRSLMKVYLYKNTRYDGHYSCFKNMRYQLRIIFSSTQNDGSLLVNRGNCSIYLSTFFFSFRKSSTPSALIAAFGGSSRGKTKRRYPGGLDVRKR